MYNLRSRRQRPLNESKSPEIHATVQPKTVPISDEAFIALYAIITVFMSLGPPWLRAEFAWQPLMHVGEVIELVIPIANVVLFYLLAFHKDWDKRRLSLAQHFYFLACISIWIMGMGIHLSANSIGNNLHDKDTKLYTLCDWYDEVLSHYMWHGGSVMGMFLVFWKGQTSGSMPSIRAYAVVAASGLMNAFAYFLMSVESQTGPLSLIFTPAVILWCLLRPKLLKFDLYVLFYFTTFVGSIPWFVWWLMRNNWVLVEFSELGMM